MIIHFVKNYPDQLITWINVWLMSYVDIENQRETCETRTVWSVTELLVMHPFGWKNKVINYVNVWTYETTQTPIGLNNT